MDEVDSEKDRRTLERIALLVDLALDSDEQTYEVALDEIRRLVG